MKRSAACLAVAAVAGLAWSAPQAVPPVDLAIIEQIREEGFERSQLPDTLSYMTDVLGARLTVSPGMRRAQRWVMGSLSSAPTALSWLATQRPAPSWP